MYFANLPVKQAVCLESTALGYYLDVLRQLSYNASTARSLDLSTEKAVITVFSMIVHLHRNLLQEAKLRLYLYQIHVFSKKIKIKENGIILETDLYTFPPRIDLGEFGKRSNRFPVGDHSRTFSLFYVLTFLGES